MKCQVEILAPSDKNTFDLTGNGQRFLMEAILGDPNEKKVTTFLPLDLCAKAEAAGIDFATAFVRGLQEELQLH